MEYTNNGCPPNWEYRSFSWCALSEFELACDIMGDLEYKILSLEFSTVKETKMVTGHVMLSPLAIASITGYNAKTRH